MSIGLPKIFHSYIEYVSDIDKLQLLHIGLKLSILINPPLLSGTICPA